MRTINVLATQPISVYDGAKIEPVSSASSPLVAAGSIATTNG